MSNFNEFRTQISGAGGVINSNRFNVVITPTGNFGLSRIIGSQNRLLLKPETVQIPGSQIGSFENQTNRGLIKYPNIRTYEDVTMSFIVSKDYRPVRFFKQWHEAILPKEEWFARYINDYVGDIEIIHQDRFDNNVYTCKLVNAWPVGVNSIDLDSGSADIPTKLSVSFTYERFEDTFHTDNIDNRL